MTWDSMAETGGSKMLKPCQYYYGEGCKMMDGANFG